MQAGKMRHRVTLQRAKPIRDYFGQSVMNWTDVQTVWAEVEWVTGKELVIGHAEQAETTLKITLRYRPDLRTDWRIIHHPPTGYGEICAIDAVLPDARKTRLEVLCSSGVKHD